MNETNAPTRQPFFSLVKATDSAIVGGWYKSSGVDPINGQASSYSVLTFLSNGTYFLAETDTAPDPSGQNGIEHGTYSWDSNGAFSVTTLADTNGDWGLSNIAITSLNVTGDTLTLSTPEGDSIGKRIASSPASAIVGSWYGTQLGQANSDAVITFLSDGTYFMSEDGNSALDPSGHDGMERGTYSWNPVTGAFSSSTSVDTSDEWGLSHADISNLSILDGVLTVNTDTTGPKIAALNPASESTGVGVSDSIVITFDETIQKAKGSLVLMTSAGKTVETFKIASSTAISISGDTLTINPSKDLSYATGYKLKIAPGAITDVAHNAYTGLTGYHFTTTDTLTTSALSYVLTAKDPKKLAYSGTGDFSGTGNRSNNKIAGSVGNDTLNGGVGNDTLTGGDGADQFVFNSKAGKTNIDTIADFTPGIDKIVLGHAIFKQLSSTIASDELATGTAAADSNDYLVYNSVNGRLLYDADGSGTGKAVEIAVIGTGLNLTADDFAIN